MAIIVCAAIKNKLPYVPLYHPKFYYCPLLAILAISMLSRLKYTYIPIASNTYHIGTIPYGLPLAPTGKN